MRWCNKGMILVGLVLACANLATAQQPLGFGKGPSGPASLIQNDSVKKELRLTDEQAAKIPEALMKALAEVLDPDQMKRLKQIDLQVKGSKAFADPMVQTSLNMNAEQKESIKEILAATDKELGDLAKDMQREIKSGNFTAIEGMREKMKVLTKETSERCSSVLTSDQRRMWQEMIGDEFRLETPTFDPKKKK